MFYVSTLRKTILLEPVALSCNVGHVVKSRLMESVEGRCLGGDGYVIGVLSILECSEGIVAYDGNTRFEVLYKALVLNVSKGDVVDAVVSETNKMGIFASIGPLTIFVSNYQIPNTVGAVPKNTILRLRIIGMKVEISKIFAIGTLNDDFLGVVC